MLEPQTYRTYLESHPELQLSPEGTRGEWRGSCPFHTGGTGGKNFSINDRTGVWICRSASCGLRGGFAAFYKLVEGIATWGQVYAQLGKSYPLRDWGEYLGLLSRGEKQSGVTYQDLPLDVFQRPITLQLFPDYLRYRGFDERLLECGLDLRVCVAGDYRGRLLFPFYDLDGRLLTFTARAMGEVDQSQRYRFPPGASISQFLYGVHRLNGLVQLDWLWVVEGQFDVLRLATLGRFAVGLSTSTISPRQSLDVRRLHKLLGCQVCVCLDRGAFGKASKVRAELSGLGVPAVAIDMSDVAKDPGELTYEGLLRLESMRDEQ